MNAAQPAVRAAGVAAPLLVVSGLARAFGGVRALAGLSFALAPGEMLAMIGPNGAGKSTCFNLLNGQLRPDAGRIVLDGRDIAGLPPRRIARLGVGRTFQVAATWSSLTVRENVQLALLAHHRQLARWWPLARGLHRDRAQALLERVGLGQAAERPCAQLAYGDLKAVELAVALAADPRLLLMDEPTAGMSPGERGALMRLVHGLSRELGIAVLFTEHSMDVVFEHADRILVLADGQRIAEGPPAVIRADPRVAQVYLGSGRFAAPALADTEPAA
jgi:branched-chain amino acid transport system ATP-binding protein